MKPSYYNEFYCIADKCEFTCCQEWKIGVDDKTYCEWQNTIAEDLLRDKADNKGNKLSDYVVENDGNRVMGLCENRLCPFLSDKKLCNIVLKHGEGFISETCHTFPREEHEFNNHKEQTLMLCCPYVIDLLNRENEFRLIEEPEELSELFELRKDIIDFLQNNKENDGLKLEDKLLIVFYILLECYENDDYNKDLWMLVPELVKTFEKMERSSKDTLNECNELMLDLIDNYLKEGVYEKYLEKLNNEALELEGALKAADLSMEEAKTLSDFDSKWKEYESLLIKVLSQEIFGEVIIDEDDIEGMLVKYQWIMMEYSLIKHFCYLHYRSKNELDYDIIKRYMVIGFRIMGFDDDDIYEYMENSFEELIWDFAYMFLLLY